MKRKAWKRACALLCTLALSVGLMASAAAAQGGARFSTLEDFSGATVATMTGSSHGELMRASVGDVECQYYDDVSSMLLALQNGVVDGVVTDLPVAQLSMARQPGLAIFPESIAPDSYGLGLPKDSPLTDQISAILEGYEADGTLDALAEKWMGADESVKQLEMEDYDAPNGVLRYAHVSTSEPMSYVGANGASMGYEVELVYLIAKELGMELEITQGNFTGVMAMLQSGQADIISGSISITEERRESIDFPTACYTGGVVLVVQAEDLGISPSGARFQTLEDFSGATVAGFTGTSHDQILLDHVDGVEFQYFEDLSSQLLALQSGTVDAVINDLPVVNLAAARQPDLAVFPEIVAEDSYGLALPKDSPLTDQISAIIEGFRADGTLDALEAEWMGADESAKSVDVGEYDAPNGVLRYAHESTMEPMSYVGDDGSSMGYEVELVYLIARELGMELEITQTMFSALIPMLQSGRADIISGSISITDERRESIDFPTAHYTGGVVLLARAEEPGISSSGVRFQTLEDFSGATVSALTGTVHDQTMSSVVEGVEFQYYDDNPSRLLALQNGVVDAMVAALPVAQRAVARQPGLAIFPEPLAPDSYSLGLRKGSPLTDQISAIIEGYEADGTLDALAEKWMGADESVKQLEMEDYDAPNGVLRYAHVSTSEPMSYVGANGASMGYEVELVYLIAKELGMELEITQGNFTGVMAMLQSGQADIISGSISITEERRESIDFPTACYTGGVVLVVQAEDLGISPSGARFQTLEDFSGATVAGFTGTSHDQILLDHVDGVEFQYFEDLSSQLLALQSGTVDAVINDLPVVNLAAARQPDLAVFPEIVAEDSYGLALPKDSPLTDQISAIIEGFRADGTLDALEAEWMGADESAKSVDVGEYDAPNGVLRYAHESTMEPMSYVGDDGSSMGYEVELVSLIARELGMELEITQGNFSGIMAMLQSGMVDIISSSISITDERRESIDFPTAHYTGGVSLLVRAEDLGRAVETEDAGFLAGLADSFYRNFIEENRWRMVLSGLGVTCVISVFSALLGTVLGFGLCLVRRSRFRLASGLAGAFIRFIQGIPVLVLLMVLFYVVFAQSSLSGVVVSIVAFSINFAVYVSEMMRTGIDAVDVGQWEAAAALGFGSREYELICLD